MTKQEIITDASLFHRACSMYVDRNVLYCVSALMCDIGQHVEEASKIFDTDSDEMYGWFVQDDYEEAVNDFIDSAELDDLETVAEECGYWSDVLDASDVPEVVEIEDEGETSYSFGDLSARFDDEDDATFAAQASVIDVIRDKVKGTVTNDEERRNLAATFGLEPEQREVYEHWLVDRYFAKELQELGELVFEFEAMTLWGRTTTGQSISMDYVIRSLVKGLSDEHWVWRA